MSSSVPPSGPSSGPSSSGSPASSSGGAAAPRCGRFGRGHDPHHIQVLTVDRDHAHRARSIDDLYVEIGTRLVVLCDGVPHVLYSHTPQRVVEQWDRCRAAGISASWNPASGLLRFPHSHPPASSTSVVSVSDEPVRCQLANAADRAAQRLLWRYTRVLEAGRDEASSPDPTDEHGDSAP